MTWNVRSLYGTTVRHFQPAGLMIWNTDVDLFKIYWNGGASFIDLLSRRR